VTHAELIRQTALISRIAAQYTHELAFGAWNPNFCSADAKYEADRFLEEVGERLEVIRAAVGSVSKP
jgi:hypothetical protein